MVYHPSFLVDSCTVRWIALFIFSFCPLVDGIPNPNTTAAPTSAPLNFLVTSSECQTLEFYWNPPAVGDRNGVIIEYRLSCQPREFLDLPWVIGTPGAHTITGFLPGTSYTCTVAAGNTLGFGPNAQGSAETPECTFTLCEYVLHSKSRCIVLHGLTME